MRQPTGTFGDGSTVALLVGAVIVAGCLLGAAAGTSAQEPEAAPVTAAQAGAEPAEEPAGGPFSEAIHVNIVNVDVYVTDKQGNPVADLTVDDFEVFENNRPMEITNFYAMREGVPVAGPGAEPAALEPLDTGEVASAPPPLPARLGVEIPEDQRLRVIVFVDNFNVRPLDRNRVMWELRAFLERHLGPEDRVMLATYDRSFKVRQPFTNDPLIVANALTELETTSGHRLAQDNDRRQAIRDIEGAEDGERALSLIRPYAESVLNDLNFTIDGLREAIDLLKGLPGRKMLIHLSGGLPMVAGADLFYAVENKFLGTAAINQMFNFDASRRFKELSAQANANRISFYTIDATGLTTDASAAAEERGLGDERMAGNIDSDNRANLHSPLKYLADRTGGVAIVNQNRILPGLEQVAASFRTYYSLGYAPPHHGDGRYYDIQVKVKQRGLKVRHREGYRDKTTHERMTEGTQAALFHGQEVNPLAVELTFGSGTEHSEGNLLVPFEVRIPLDHLVLVPAGEFHRATIRLWVGAVDEQGRTSDIQPTQPISVSIPSAQLDPSQTQYYVYKDQLLMRRGRQRIALGVRDEMAAEASFLTRSFVAGG